MIIVIILMHVVTLAALAHIALNGPGPYSIEEIGVLFDDQNDQKVKKKTKKK